MPWFACRDPLLRTAPSIHPAQNLVYCTHLVWELPYALHQVLVAGGVPRHQAANGGDDVEGVGVIHLTQQRHLDLCGCGGVGGPGSEMLIEGC